jgi:protein SCO1/2
MKKKSYASIIAIILGLCVVFVLMRTFHSSNLSSPTIEVISGGDQQIFDKNVPIGGPFHLIDHHGQPRSDVDFKGKIMLVYFGYSFCPDVCPAGLYHISQALHEMGAKAKEIQPLFITVDPERDTVQNLALYMENFHPQFLGLTGTPEAINKAVKAYRVYAQKAKPDGTSTDYLIDHSSIVYVMDRQGRFLTSFNHQTEPAQIKAILKSYL